MKRIHTRVIKILAVLLTLGTSYAGASGRALADTMISSPPSITVNGESLVFVSTAAQLKYIDQNQSQYLYSSISLLNNIDLSGFNWVPLGNQYGWYAGTFNGMGHTITGIRSQATGQDFDGFFGVLYGTIENLRIGATVTGGGYVGGLVGSMVGGTISNCSTTSSTAVSGQDGRIGGLVGLQKGGAIVGSSSYGTVSGDGSSNGGLVGGQSGGVITSSYSDASVDGNDDAEGAHNGGLVGWQEGSVTDAYAMGQVSGAAAALGGLVGYLNGGSITDTYATGLVYGSGIDGVGGLIGQASDNGSVSNSFFDMSTTGQVSGVGSGPSNGVTGELTAAMKTKSTYNSWNFTNTWGIYPGINNGYPYLRGGFSQGLPFAFS